MFTKLTTQETIRTYIPFDPSLDKLEYSFHITARQRSPSRFATLVYNVNPPETPQSYSTLTLFEICQNVHNPDPAARSHVEQELATERHETVSPRRKKRKVTPEGTHQDPIEFSSDSEVGPEIEEKELQEPEENPDLDSQSNDISANGGEGSTTGEEPAGAEHRTRTQRYVDGLLITSIDARKPAALRRFGSVQTSASTRSKITPQSGPNGSAQPSISSYDSTTAPTKQISKSVTESVDQVQAPKLTDHPAPTTNGGSARNAPTTVGSSTTRPIAPLSNAMMSAITGTRSAPRTQPMKDQEITSSDFVPPAPTKSTVRRHDLIRKVTSPSDTTPTPASITRTSEPVTESAKQLRAPKSTKPAPATNTASPQHAPTPSSFSISSTTDRSTSPARVAPPAATPCPPPWQAVPGTSIPSIYSADITPPATATATSSTSDKVVGLLPTPSTAATATVDHQMLGSRPLPGPLPASSPTTINASGAGAGAGVSTNDKLVRPKTTATSSDKTSKPDPPILATNKSTALPIHPSLPRKPSSCVNQSKSSAVESPSHDNGREGSSEEAAHGQEIAVSE